MNPPGEHKNTREAWEEATKHLKLAYVEPIKTFEDYRRVYRLASVRGFPGGQRP